MGALVNTFIGISIALLPLFTLVAERDISRLSKDNLLVVLMMMFCFLLPSKKRALPKIALIGVAFALVSLFLNQWNPLSIVVQYQTFYISAGLIFFACYYEKFTHHKLEHVLNGMAMGCVIQSALVIFNHFGVDIYQEIVTFICGDVVKSKVSEKAVGSLGNSNLLASYISLTIISLYRKKWIYLIPLPILALVFSKSMMGYATALAGAVYFINQKQNFIKKIYLYSASALLMLAGYFHGLWGQDSHRFYVWGETLKRVDLSHFLIGKGPGWFYNHGVVITKAEIAVQEHNEFLALFNIFGITGVLLLLSIFSGFLFRKDVNIFFSSILFAGFCNSYGHFTFHQSTTALILIVSASVCLAERNKYVI